MVWRGFYAFVYHNKTKSNINRILSFNRSACRGNCSHINRSSRSGAAAQREIPIYYVDTDKKQVALSFDAAWGNEQTEHLLEILDKYKVKSTFFLVGDWVKNYPDSVKDIAKHGHDVGNHSNTHPHMTQMSSSDMVGQIQSCNEKIKELTGKTPTLFRAPYGDYNNDVVKSVNGCNMYCVQWDVDSLDWKDPTPEQIKQNIMKKNQERQYYIDA